MLKIFKILFAFFIINQILFASEINLSEEEKEYLKNKKVIKMCVLPNWLPFEQIDKYNKHKGAGNEIIQLISKKLDMPFVLVPTKKWSKSLENIKNRKCDILPVAMDTPSRRDSMNFTKPYTKEPYVIATKLDKLFIKDSSEIGDKKIAVVGSYAIKEVLKKTNPGIKIISVKNAKEGLEKVQSGEIYGYVDIISAIVYTMQQNSILNLKIAGKLEMDIKLSIASRNDEPLLNDILQKSLDTISEGDIKKIVGKWLSIKVEENVDYTELLQITAIFIVFILVVLYKNRQVFLINEKLYEANQEVVEQQKMVDEHVMIITTDLKGIITDVNSAYCKKMGFEKKELISSSFKSIRHPDMPEKIFKKLWDDIQANRVWHGEIKNLTKTNDSIYLQMVIAPQFKKGKNIGYRAICEDISDKKRIEKLSTTDKLTGLYNRMKLDELMIEQVNLFKRYHIPFATILIDIDNFKPINDTYGHDVGDEVLRRVAKILNANIRNTEFAGRWGGEEFLIICQNINLEQAYLLAEKIRKIIEIHSFDEIGQLTISLGVSEFQKDDNLLSIFKSVDKALYYAKNNGKNRTIKSIDIKE